MKLSDGFSTGRSTIADSSAPLRSAATDSAAANAGKGAAFDDILSEVCKRDGVTEEPSPPPKLSDVATPASIPGTFSVSVGAAVHTDSSLRPSAVAARFGGEIGAGDTASGAAGDLGTLTGADGRSFAATWRSAQGANASAAALPVLQSPAMRSPSTLSATDEGDASATTKRRTESDFSPAAASSPNATPAISSSAGPSPARRGAQAANAPAVAVLFGAAADGAPSPAFFGPGGTSFAPDSTSDSKSSVSVRGGAARGRAIEPMRWDRATANRQDDSGGLQLLAQPFPAAGPAAAASPLSPQAQPEDAASNLERAASALAAPAAILLASDARLTPMQSPARGIATQAANLGLAQAASAPATGDATRFSSLDSAPLRFGPPDAATGQAPVKVAVLDQQTHFPPLAPSSPIDQIANRIVAEASPALASAPADAGGSAPSGVALSSGVGEIQSQAPLSATRVLLLQLEPQGLGVVSIRMRLSGDRLDLEVEATRADTMRRIGDDSDLLVEKLRSAGYAMDHVVVKVAEPQAAQTQHGLGAGESHAFEGSGDASVSSPGTSQQGGSSANEGSGAQAHRTPSAASTTGAEDRSVGRDDSGAVYL